MIGIDWGHGLAIALILGGLAVVLVSLSSSSRSPRSDGRTCPVPPPRCATPRRRRVQTSIERRGVVLQHQSSEIEGITFGRGSLTSSFDLRPSDTTITDCTILGEDDES